MKHIKKYNTLYTKITRTDYFSCNRKETSEDIVKRLKDKFPNLLITTTQYTVLIDNLKWVTHIFESDEEWFYIFFDHPDEDIYYKCDQIDGLIDCLKEIYSI